MGRSVIVIALSFIGCHFSEGEGKKTPSSKAGSPPPVVHANTDRSAATLPKPPAVEATVESTQSSRPSAPAEAALEAASAQTNAPTAMLSTDEKVIFSFKTKSGKTMNIVVGKDNRYMAYRFGTDKRVELQFPPTLDKDSFKQFEYEYYFRGGGPENEGMDMNHLIFKGTSNQFAVYEQQTFDERGRPDYGVGISIMHFKTGKSTEIKGILSSVEGSLSELRYDDMLRELVPQSSMAK